MSELTMLDKIKLYFTVQGAYEKFLAGPKSSFQSGEFWAKVAAAACVIWAGVQGFVPHPYDIYITVGLALWISLERYYLKKNHLEALVDLSAAPAFDPNQFAQTMAALVAKYPTLKGTEGPITAAVTETIKETTTSVDLPASSVSPK